MSLGNQASKQPANNQISSSFSKSRKNSLGRRVGEILVLMIVHLSRTVSSIPSSGNDTG